MRLVILESPYSGDVALNTHYLRLAMRDCLLRGEAPYASHGLYTQAGVLDDNIPAERELGIEAGLTWGEKASATVVYSDLGLSNGMRYGIEVAKSVGRPVEYRHVPGFNPSEVQHQLAQESHAPANVGSAAVQLSAVVQSMMSLTRNLGQANNLVQALSKKMAGETAPPSLELADLAAVFEATFPSEGLPVEMPPRHAAGEAAIRSFRVAELWSPASQKSELLLVQGEREIASVAVSSYFQRWVTPELRTSDLFTQANPQPVEPAALPVSLAQLEEELQQARSLLHRWKS